jgi:hypothetical protein
MGRAFNKPRKKFDPESYKFSWPIQMQCSCYKHAIHPRDQCENIVGRFMKELNYGG